MATTVNPSLKALVLLAELAGHLNQDAATYSDALKDAMQRLINGVSEAIEGHCRAPLIKAAATEYYDGGRTKIILERAPVDTAETFTVLEDGTALTPAADGSSKTAASGTPDFYLDPGAGIIERDGTWADGKRIVKVTYTAGQGWQYQDAGGTTRRTATTQTLGLVGIPDDLRQAALIVCQAHTDLGITNWGTQILPQGQVLRPNAWPRLALEILDRYVMPR